MSAWRLASGAIGLTYPYYQRGGGAQVDYRFVRFGANESIEGANESIVGFRLYEVTHEWACSDAPVIWNGTAEDIRPCSMACSDHDDCSSFEFQNKSGNYWGWGVCTLMSSNASSQTTLLNMTCPSGQADAERDHFTILAASHHPGYLPKSFPRTHAGVQWEMTPDFDCFHGDLFNAAVPENDTRVRDREDCAIACRDDPRCVAFNFPRAGHIYTYLDQPVCYLKKGMDSLNLPSRRIVCNSGVFTPNWAYYTALPQRDSPEGAAENATTTDALRDDALRDGPSSEVIGGAVGGSLAAAGLIAGLIGGLLTPAPTPSPQGGSTATTTLKRETTATTTGTTTTNFNPALGSSAGDTTHFFAWSSHFSGWSSSVIIGAGLVIIVVLLYREWRSFSWAERPPPLVCDSANDSEREVTGTSVLQTMSREESESDAVSFISRMSSRQGSGLFPSRSRGEDESETSLFTPRISPRQLRRAIYI